jgi:carbonic anhydrase
MINKIVEIAEELSKQRRADPELLTRMETAAHSQSPRFLLISPIDRCAQDLHLFQMAIGDAFHATRVPRMPLLPPKRSPMLFSGPAAYYRGLSGKQGVILTFEQDEPEHVIRESLDNLMLHPDIAGLPVLAFRIDYDLGRARLVPHGKGRDYETETKLLSRLQRPDTLDTNTLILICSDSRVQPPATPHGLPMAIKTLGGFIPSYSGLDDESHQLADFFSDWLSERTTSEILIVAHGNFEGEGSSCGAAEDSLNPDEAENPILRFIFSELQEAASNFETQPAKSPEARAKALSQAVRENLLTYEAIREFSAVHSHNPIDIILMDTLSNVLFTINI